MTVGKDATASKRIVVFGGRRRDKFVVDKGIKGTIRHIAVGVQHFVTHICIMFVYFPPCSL
jgi:hypothetical protein